MAWCRQTMNHYLSQCWLWFQLTYDMGLQWVKKLAHVDSISPLLPFSICEAYLFFNSSCLCTFCVRQVKFTLMYIRFKNKCFVFDERLALLSCCKYTYHCGISDAYWSCFYAEIGPCITNSTCIKNMGRNHSSMANLKSDRSWVAAFQFLTGFLLAQVWGRSCHAFGIV